MSEEILWKIIKSEVEGENFTVWLQGFFLREDVRDVCTIESFTMFFLNFIRSQTERFIRGGTSCDTPNKHLLSISETKHSTPSTQPIVTKQLNTCEPSCYMVNESSSQIIDGKFPLNYSETLLQNQKSLSISYDDSHNNSSMKQSINKSTKHHQIQSSVDENHFKKNKNINNECNSPLENISPSVNHLNQKHLQHQQYNTIAKSASQTSIHNTNERNRIEFEGYIDLEENNFPSLSKNYKSNTSTPIKKLNKSGSHERSLNYSSPTTTYFNSPNNNKNWRTYKYSNFSTPNTSDYRNHSSSLSLGDFVSSPTLSTKHQKNSNKRNQSDRSNGSPVIENRKRVIPTRVNINASHNISSFVNPALSVNVGDISNIGQEEILDRKNCIIKKDRENLKSQMHLIAKEFKEENSSIELDNLSVRHIQAVANDAKFTDSLYNNKGQQQIEKLPSVTSIESQKECSTESATSDILSSLKIDFNKITHRMILNKFIEIHSALIELNLVTNILNEFSFFLNFFNMDPKVFKNFLENSSTNSISNTTAVTTESIPIENMTQPNIPSDIIQSVEINRNYSNENFHEALKQAPKDYTEFNSSNSISINSNKIPNKNIDLIQEPLTKKSNNVISGTADVSDFNTEFNPVNVIQVNQQSNIEKSSTKFETTTGTPTIRTNIETGTSITSTASIDSKLINLTIDLNIELNFVFKNFLNCLYYALGVLDKQKICLALLDTTSLKVILKNKLLEKCGKNLYDFLKQIRNRKIELENSNSNFDISSKLYNCGKYNNVSYVPESDTKSNFPSVQECDNFKKQRDLFYFILRMWEQKPVNPQWDFEENLGWNIHTLLQFSENPINMAHLAKLFVSQLIISLNSCKPPADDEYSFSKVDMGKLTKLNQRLVTPSHFSQKYEFPENQQFFKDFIVIAQSRAFAEQLKLILISELLELNNSTYEMIDLASKKPSNAVAPVIIEELSYSGSSDNQDNNEKNSNEDKNSDFEIQHVDRHNIASVASENIYHEYFVKPEIISTMRVLAKFLGLVMFLPYGYEGNRNPLIDNKQIELRNLLQPEFDFLPILKKSVMEKRLTITLPWIIEFLSMFDEITLKLKYYRIIINYLFELYIKLNTYTCHKYVYPKDFLNNQGHFGNEMKNIIKLNHNENIDIDLATMRPTSIFMLKILLGWFFERYNLSEDYLTFRESYFKEFIHNYNNIQQQSHQQKQYNQSIKGLINKNSIDGINLIEEHIDIDTKNRLFDALEENYKIKVQNTENLYIMKYTFDPLLESIFNVSCSSLADFRISIMPPKITKTASRSGRLRVIKTNLFPFSTTSVITKSVTSNISQLKRKKNDKSAVGNGSQDSQTKLIEAFLHSESLSVRRIVEFVIERTTSAVIKDFQMEIFCRKRNETNMKIDKITAKELKHVKQEMLEIYKAAYEEVIETWDSLMPDMIKTRVEKSLDGLLPNETLPIVKQTCASIIIQKCKLITNDWRDMNMTIEQFYCKDIDNEAEKIAKGCKKNEYITELGIDLSKNPPPSEIFSQFQFWLHATNRRLHLVNEPELLKFCDELEMTMKSHLLPTNYYKFVGLTSVYLVQNLVLNIYEILTETLLKRFIDIWYVDKMVEFSKIIESDDTNNHSENFENESSPEKSLSGGAKKCKKRNKFNIFNSLFSESFLKPLCGTKSLKHIEKYIDLIVQLITNNLLTLHYVNNKFIALFKKNWTNVEYKNLTKILECISGNALIIGLDHETNDDSKSHLFMEMLSDLLRDIDEY